MVQGKPQLKLEIHAIISEIIDATNGGTNFDFMRSTDIVKRS